MNTELALGVSGVSFAASLGINAWLTRAAQRRGWCDPAGGLLKIHSRPVPFVGGVGVLAALALGLALAVGWDAARTAGVQPGHLRLMPLVLVGLVALALGMWDDFRWKTLSIPVPKLGLQLAAATLMAVMLRSLGVVTAGLAVVPGLALAAGYLLCAMNAVNLEDGMDGLAGGEALVSALGFAIWALLAARPDVGVPALALAGAVVGFLTLNWHPARIFLGDGGSHLVGALLGVLALQVVGVAGPRAIPGTILMVGLPVLDTVWVILHRLARGRSVMSGDRSHCYDLLHKAGLSIRQTVVVCWLIQAALVAAGLELVSRGVR